MKIGDMCPKCKEGAIVLRASIYGKFGGCSNYPKCRFAITISKQNELEEYLG